jgi:hypothetical protein
MSTSVRVSLTVLTLGVLATLPSPADAGLRRLCRKHCKPAIAECIATTGQSRRACKSPILRQCRLEGLQVCEAGGEPGDGVTTTTIGSSPKTTTTTLPPAPGVLDLDVEDIERDASTDPGVYSLRVTVTGDAESIPVSLDPSSFYVLDKADNRYETQPAATLDDCSADDVVATDGTVTCWVNFTLPLVVGFDEPTGEGYAELYLEVGGYRRVVYFKVHEGGGWGTIS